MADTNADAAAAVSPYASTRKGVATVSTAPRTPLKSALRRRHTPKTRSVELRGGAGGLAPPAAVVVVTATTVAGVDVATGAGAPVAAVGAATAAADT